MGLNELPTQINLSLLRAFNQIPREVAIKIYEDILGGGSTAIPYFDFITDFINNDDVFNDDDIAICLRMAIYTINYLSTEDPSSLHYCAAREALKSIGDGAVEADEKARDLLARELVKECNELASIILPRELLQENVSDEQKALFIVSQKNENSIHLVHPIEDKLWLDELFIQHISKIGATGKSEGLKFSEASKKWYQEYLSNNKAIELFRLWVDRDREPYYCRYLTMLASILWQDRIAAQFEKTQKQLPALTQGVSRPVSRILSSRAQVDTVKGTIAYEGKILAEIPTIDPQLMPSVLKGSLNLNTIYHHKLIRFECKSGFEKWAQGSPDPRVLRFEGGETEIAEKLGIKNKEAPSTIRDLLRAQAHMNFHFDDGSYGNLIVLRQFKSRKTNRDEGVEIVMGTQLMPGYTFTTDKRNRLLVPVPELPPLVSSTNYHAGQSLLQMLIMEEFTNNSIDLAINGFVEIPEARWKAFLKQSCLPESVFKNVIARWLSDGDDGGRFLIQIDKDRFTLGEEYSKELNFLIFQGEHRKEQKARGLISVKKERKSAQKKTSP